MSTDGNPPPVIVDIVPDDPNHPPGWDPQPGPETGLLNLPPGARDQIKRKPGASSGVASILTVRLSHRPALRWGTSRAVRPRHSRR